MPINCHCHIFSLECVPLAFRQRFVLDLRSPRQALAHRAVRAVLMPGVRLETWLDFTHLTTAQIAEALVAEMDEAGVELATPLMVDMEFSSAYPGGVKAYDEQIAETLAAVAQVNARSPAPRLLPFIGADPRRPGVADLVLGHLATGAFKGVKIYPVMGFLPDDERLYPVYAWCEAHRVPVTAHCENGGLPGYDGFYHLAAPENWEPVLRRFPALVLNLAHFDRTGTPWQATIEGLMQRFPHVYTDVSFDTEMFWMPGRYFANLHRVLRTPVLQDRLLYGTDWYMGRFLWSEKTYLTWFTRGARRIFWSPVRFTRGDLRRLTEDNPRRFLGLA
ncbi:MAG: amidohydrolase family protein [Candidatus Riflebacteria bacterium]|nr:amidohydrolase family protein [Candidatus Riflebacteria bacterium]